jgi:hypothetical protein
MNTTMTNNNQKIIKLADEAAKMMVNGTRKDGTTFVKFNDNRPDWMQDLAHTAHGDMMPDDFRYRFISESLELISDASEDEDLDDLGNDEIQPDVYNSDRLAWLSSNLNRAEYCNELLSGASDIFEVIGDGQLYEKHEVYCLVLKFLRDLADEMEEDEETEEDTE